MRVINNTVVKRQACANEYIFWQPRANFPRKNLKWYYDQKSPYLFFLHFESMIYKYLPSQSLGHDFDEKSDFLNYKFSKRLPAITELKNVRVQKRVGSREDVASSNQDI